MIQDKEMREKIMAMLNPVPEPPTPEETSYGQLIYNLALKLEKDMEVQGKRMWVLGSLAFVAAASGIVIVIWLGFG